MIFGLTIEKLVVIGVIAALILGPDRLPRYAAMLAQAVKRGRAMLGTAKERMQDELGDDVDWRSLDPRQYDPRRIIREALLEDTPPLATAASVSTEPARTPQAYRPGAPVPFDSEAT
ncbi:Sec-independent protein translocase TatB [Microbacterium terrisoli]|jgi:sec-independent protein translocase protein TatB|uniref:Sec-independent protein translocase TatB n=1 Tax=Microbacterium terrisoli TaxID=3242192 RepID=UPI0028038688|nr:Sec-independent protein translocase TatB [Microbacterium protaetiae]